MGYLAADALTVARLASGGLLDSGGGINHLGALIVAELATSGAYEPHVDRLRAALAGRRDVLAAGLREHVPGATFLLPGGGYFIWLRLPPNVSAAEVLQRAASRGTGGLAGSAFTPGGATDRNVIRLSFSMYPPNQLAEATRRLGAAVRETQEHEAPAAHVGSR